MSERSPIPNLPPLSGVKDPAVRSYLEALTQAWLVRNGQTRDTGERFLTVKDLQGGIQQAVNGGSAGRFLGSAANPTQSAIASAIQALVDDVQQSRLWKLLGERIQQIEMPEWFSGRFGAEIKTEIIKQENASNALVSQVNTAVTNINGNIAIARQEIKTVSDQAGAMAEEITTLQTTVSGTTSTAEQAFDLAQDIDNNLTGYWGVKFDAGGYLASFGLSLDGTAQAPTSEFGVRADRFYIGPAANPAGLDDPDIPFVVTTTPRTVDGVAYPPGAWIKTSYIADATIGTAKISNAAITTAKIGDAQVDTLQIKGDAVTVPQFFSGRYASMNLGGGGAIIIYSCDTGNNDRICTFTMYVNGNEVHRQQAGARSDNGTDTRSRIPVVLVYGLSGSHNEITVMVEHTVVASTVTQERIVILGAKR